MSSPEEDRARIIARLKARRPDADVESKLGGTLAGPPDDHRPPVPIWDYIQWYEEHPDAAVKAMRDVRIPVMLPGGEESVLALSDEMFADIRDVPPVTEQDAVRLYAMLHEAGVVMWDEERNMLRYIASVSARDDVIREWFAELRGNAPTE